MPLFVAEYLRRSAAAFERLAGEAALIASIGEAMADALRAGRRILICGNGGSAADAQHMAAELVGRYLANGRALPAIALTVDSSALTAIGNDFGFEQVFARQVEALGGAGDVLVAISTSGNSANVMQAARAARAGGLRVVGLTGAGGGMLAALCDDCVRVPSDATPHIQEMHIAVIHLWCGIIERHCR